MLARVRFWMDLFSGASRLVGCPATRVIERRKDRSERGVVRDQVDVRLRCERSELVRYSKVYVHVPDEEKGVSKPVVEAKDGEAEARDCAPGQ
jgi:hypothetical protein